MPELNEAILNNSINSLEFINKFFRYLHYNVSFGNSLLRSLIDMTRLLKKCNNKIRKQVFIVKYIHNRGAQPTSDQVQLLKDNIQKSSIYRKLSMLGNRLQLNIELEINFDEKRDFQGFRFVYSQQRNIVCEYIINSRSYDGLVNRLSVNKKKYYRFKHLPRPPKGYEIYVNVNEDKPCYVLNQLPRASFLLDSRQSLTEENFSHNLKLELDIEIQFRPLSIFVFNNADLHGFTAKNHLITSAGTRLNANNIEAAYVIFNDLVSNNTNRFILGDLGFRGNFKIDCDYEGHEYTWDFRDFTPPDLIFYSKTMILQVQVCHHIMPCKSSVP